MELLGDHRQAAVVLFLLLLALLTFHFGAREESLPLSFGISSPPQETSRLSRASTTAMIRSETRGTAALAAIPGAISRLATPTVDSKDTPASVSVPPLSRQPVSTMRTTPSAVINHLCVNLNGSAAILASERIDAKPGVWHGELCTYTRAEPGGDGLARGYVVLRAPGSCVDDPTRRNTRASKGDRVIRSVTGRKAAQAAGPHDLTVRLMGPEIVDAPVVHRGGCEYRANFTLGSSGRYNVQVTLWRSDFGAFGEGLVWNGFQEDDIFGRDVWLTAATASTTLNSTFCDNNNNTSASPLHCWDNYATSAGLPACDCKSLHDCSKAMPGRWIAMEPPFSVQRKGIGTALLWSADFENGIAWRRYACRDVTSSNAMRLANIEGLLQGRRVIFVGDSQARMYFNAALQFLAGSDARAVKGEGRLCVNPGQAFGNKAVWCYQENNMSPARGDIAALTANQPEVTPFHVVVMLVGNHPLSYHHWSLDQWRGMAKSIATNLVRYSLDTSAVVFWMGNAAWPWNRHEKLITTYADQRTTPRLRALDALSAAALDAAVAHVGVPESDALRRRVAFLDVLAGASQSLMDASKDSSHYAQGAFGSYQTQALLEALRVAIIPTT